jgi:hypothetical protein
LSECGAGCQGKEDISGEIRARKQRFTIPESSITLPESAPNFRDEFAVDSPLHQRVGCEPDSVGRLFGRADAAVAELIELTEVGQRHLELPRGTVAVAARHALLAPERSETFEWESLR